MENFGCYKDKLHEDKVYEGFTTIIAQSKKLIKADTKTIVEELSAKIEEERAKMVSLASESQPQNSNLCNGTSCLAVFQTFGLGGSINNGKV